MPLLKWYDFRVTPFFLLALWLSGSAEDRVGWMGGERGRSYGLLTRVVCTHLHRVGPEVIVPHTPFINLPVKLIPERSYPS